MRAASRSTSKASELRKNFTANCRMGDVVCCANTTRPWPPTLLPMCDAILQEALALVSVAPLNVVAVGNHRWVLEVNSFGYDNSSATNE